MSTLLCVLNYLLCRSTPVKGGTANGAARPWQTRRPSALVARAGWWTALALMSTLRRLRGDGCAGGPAGGPGPLEIIAAEPAGDVDRFANEI